MSIPIRNRTQVVAFKSPDYVVYPGSYRNATHIHFHASVFSQGSDGTPAGLRSVTKQTVSPPPPIDMSRDVIKFPEVRRHLAQLRAQYAIETYDSPQIGTWNSSPAQIP